MNVPDLLNALKPEILLIAVACMLFLLGVLRGAGARVLTPWLALAAMLAAAGMVMSRGDFRSETIVEAPFSQYIRVLTLVVGMLLLLLHWPTKADGSGNSALHLDTETPEYFGLMLLSFAGIMLVAGANDLILLFLGIELAALPTYVMVSISRPIAVAQEAAIKYFFLGAFSAALTLFGLTFIFGTTGQITLSGVTQAMEGMNGQPIAFSGWHALGVLMLLMGFAFKLAAFPLHFYAPDVYTGAATPLTALLSFVPKAAGLTGLIRVLMAIAGGPMGALPDWLLVVLWVIAVASMTIGNVLGLMQHNIKRLMACSSIAHSGYMLGGVLVAFGAALPVRNDALRGVLFYLTAYGLMNAGVFAVLMMLPAKSDPFEHDGKVPPATTAETFAEIAGQGRREVGLGLIMSACCFSLIGLPLTIGFFGKFFLIRPALQGGYYWLVILTVLNAAVSAGYYLRIVATMFLKDPKTEAGQAEGACVAGMCMKTVTLVLAGVLSAGGAVLFGTVIPTTNMLRTLVGSSTETRPVVRTQTQTVQLP